MCRESTWQARRKAKVLANASFFAAAHSLEVVPESFGLCCRRPPSQAQWMSRALYL